MLSTALVHNHGQPLPSVLLPQAMVMNAAVSCYLGNIRPACESVA